MNNPKIKIYLLIALGLVSVSAISLLLIYQQRKTSTLTPGKAATPEQITPDEGKTALPTLSPTEIEIIKNLETHFVSITASGFDPKEIKIKLHDQVTWTNNDTKPHQVKGENWGNVTIKPGQRFTQAFKKAGTYNYSCGLQPELKGTVIVE